MQQKIRIKKQKKNEYIFAEGIWVRNPYVNAEPMDINDLSKNDISIFLENETQNLTKKYVSSDDLIVGNIDNVIICSDGYMWKERQKLLAEIPNKKAKIIGINGALAKWEMVGNLSDRKRVMSFYLANNPYQECVSYLPNKHKYYPPLIASTRTNKKFIEGYFERPIFYRPSKEYNYSGIPRDGCMILDDYRNPLCAAISYCAKIRVKKIALFCCDESFSSERPASIRMENGLYQYPQQIRSQKIVDAQLCWLKSNGVDVVDCSSGIEYFNAPYIEMNNLGSFFDE